MRGVAAGRERAGVALADDGTRQGEAAPGEIADLGDLDGDGPVWRQIRRAVARPILAGAWPPGARIPNEQDLIARYRVARMTVHRAVRSLASDGLVARRRRRGTVVASGPPERPVFEIWNPREEIERSGRAYGFALLDRARLAGDDPRGEALGASPGERPRCGILALSGLHRADGAPVELEERLVNLDAAPEAAAADFTVEPPGAWLLRTTPWTEAEHAVGAAEATPAVAAALGLRVGAACLVVERRTWDGLRAVTFARLWRAGTAARLVGRFRPGQE